MRFVRHAIAAAAMSLAGVAQADDSMVVVELFTSQGCSSCPPADALLKELSKRDDVIALALHVDYWDYIGWKDDFADPKHVERQKGYARVAGRRSIYTPQMIIDGTNDVVGNRAKDVEMLINRHKTDQATVALSVDRSGDTVTVQAERLSGSGPLDLHFIRVDPGETVQIKRGENSGKTIDYSQIVTEWTAHSGWSGKGSYKVEFSAKGDDAVVVLAQEPDYGSILAAARLR